MKENNFEEVIGYRFSDKKLLEKALTHSSYIREHEPQNQSNERLEFIGDAFLDAIIGAEIYKRLPYCEEGKMTKLRALVVCEKSLAQVGRKLEVGQYMNMGNGEALSGGRDRESVIADAIEAIIGAVYFDGGYEAAEELVLRIMRPVIEDALAGKLFRDYKSILQEKIQAVSRDKLIYEIEREEGPDHRKTFYIRLVFRDRVIGRGSGSTKKEAEQQAAKDAYEKGVKDAL